MQGCDSAMACDRLWPFFKKGSLSAWALGAQFLANTDSRDSRKRLIVKRMTKGYIPAVV
jgi:hypothetical protein